MAIRISEIHPAESPKALNTEWFIIENIGDKPFSTKNCVISVSPPNSKKRTDLVTLDPGFLLSPGEKVRVVTGNPGRKAHGAPPKDDIRGYNLFLNSSALRGAGSTITFSLRSLMLAKGQVPG